MGTTDIKQMETKQKVIQPKQQQQSDKFDMAPDDLKFFNTKEELEQYYQEEHPQRKIVWG